MENGTGDRKENVNLRANGHTCMMDAFWFKDNMQIGACASYDVEGVCRRDPRCDFYMRMSGKGNGQFQPECMKKYREPENIRDCGAFGVVGICDMDPHCRFYRENIEQTEHAGAAGSI